jgi:hypothetical protein
MKLTIEINMDNAAFDENPEWEVGRILNKIISCLDNRSLSDLSEALYDMNGNKIGFAETEE